jgi:hypothetical protein
MTMSRRYLFASLTAAAVLALSAPAAFAQGTVLRVVPPHTQPDRSLKQACACNWRSPRPKP